MRSILFICLCLFISFNARAMFMGRSTRTLVRLGLGCPNKSVLGLYKKSPGRMWGTSIKRDYSRFSLVPSNFSDCPTHSLFDNENNRKEKDKDYVANNISVSSEEFGREVIEASHLKRPEGDVDVLSYWNKDPAMVDPKVVSHDAEVMPMDLSQMKLENSRRLLSSMEAIFPGLKFIKIHNNDVGEDRYFGIIDYNHELATKMPICYEVIASIVSMGHIEKAYYTFIDDPNDVLENPLGEKCEFYTSLRKGRFKMKINPETKEKIHLMNLVDGKIVTKGKSYSFLHIMVHEWAHVYRILMREAVENYAAEERYTDELANQMWQEVTQQHMGKPHETIDLVNPWP